EVLGLPSDFNASEIEHYSLNLLATYELKIRVGLAFDQLEEVRQSVRHASAFLDSKETHAQGTKEHTRANTKISKSRELSRRLADRYNHNVGCINTLRRILDPQGASSGSDMSSCLKLINKQKDLLISDLRAARTNGESKQSRSWIWSYVCKARGIMYQFNTNRDIAIECTQWQRTRAEKTRHNEAVNILCAEFRHSVRGFDSLRKGWENAAGCTGLSLGHKAYAHQQAQMYLWMRDECKAEYDAARQGGTDGEQLDYTMVSGYLIVMIPLLIDPS
ncbi:uncharacterized protein TRAVEDRAFT_123934, partial [Trametes versicolor FP-101664 SS1]|uniref:uncharacterized protein n=1 Tax=Trametes versicolor (strain FP-101664) TaxID=717944 RepID=UPI00046249ED